LIHHNSQQSLGDLAYYFIQSMKTAKGLNLPSNKWIVFGSSYAGSLAAWMRLHCPNLVSGAVASSAALVATADFYRKFIYFIQYKPYIQIITSFIIKQNIWKSYKLLCKQVSKALRVPMPFAKALLL